LKEEEENEKDVSGDDERRKVHVNLTQEINHE